MKMILLLTSLSAIAYTSMGQIKVGPEAGINVSGYRFSPSPRSFNSTPVWGLRLGVVADLAIGGDKFYLQPGVLYVQNGTPVNENPYTITSGSHYRVHTVEVPINVVYKFGRQGNNRPFAAAGLYLGMNLNADVSYITNYDMGAGVNAGCEFKRGLFIRAIFQQGVLRPKSSDLSVGSSNYAVTLGYFFNHNKSSRMGGRLPDDILP